MSPERTPDGPASGPRLPETLRRVIAFSRVDPASARGRVKLTHEGSMWRTRGARPLAFTATQWIEPTVAAFCWRARFKPMPGVSLYVTDAFEDGHGRLEGHLWGWLRVFRQVGPEVDRGEVYRYLAELPWAPAAYAANPALSWEEPEPGQLRVSCAWRERTLQLDYQVDPQGRIVGVRAADRPREVNGSFVDTPWSGHFDNWQLLGGVMVPTHAEVVWALPDGPFTYYRGTVSTYDPGGTAQC